MKARGWPNDISPPQSLLTSKPEAMLDVTRQHHRRAAPSPSALDAFRALVPAEGADAPGAGDLGAAPMCCCCPPPARTTASTKSKRIPIRLNSTLGRYTNFVNLMDLAAVAVPAGFTPAGPALRRLADRAGLERRRSAGARGARASRRR